MNKRKWFLITDFKSMLVPYLLYIVYLIGLCFTDKPYITSLQWNTNGSLPKIDVNIYPYVLIGLALFSTICVSYVFKETYRKNPAAYIASLRPTIFQLLYKRMIAVYAAMAVPLAIFLGFAFWRMDKYYKSFISSPIFNISEKSALYGFSIPDVSQYFINVFLQMLLALLAFILINHMLLAVSGDANTVVLTFVSYCTAEYFGLVYMIPKHGIITSAVAENHSITKMIPSYSVTHITASAICLIIVIVATKRKFSVKYL